MNTKEFIVLLITTFVVVIVWIASDIYHTKANIPILPTLQQALEPLDPNLDKATLDQIKKLNNPPTVVPNTPKPIPAPTPTITTLPTPTETALPETASPSASLEPL